PLAEAQLPTALRFLTGEATLSDDFTVSGLEDSSAERARLELTPREPTGDYEYLVFDVERTTGHLLQIAIYDAFGNENTFAFSESQFDVGLDASAFQYAPSAEYTRVEAPTSP
ncbi:MAG: outer membrane lipoprotein-sorting protein, partial [Bradymonadia bacterium]